MNLAVAAAETCHPLKEECVRRVVLFHWQHAALTRVVLNVGKHGALALSGDGNLRWLLHRMYGLGR